MEAFLNGSAVLKDTRYGCKRQVPPGSTVLVEKGARVDHQTPIASGVGRVHRVRLPAELHGCTGFRKKPGDPVKAGETLAVLTYQLGLGLAEYVCPVDGVIETILEKTMIIRSHTTDLLAGLPGVVARVVKDREVEIEAEGHLIPGWAGAGPPTFGPVYLAGELYAPTGANRSLGPQVQGTVVVSLTYTAGRALELLARYGAVALVCASLSYSEWAAFSAVTGPVPPFTVVVLEAFGSSCLVPGVKTLLGSAEGRSAYVAGGQPGEDPPVVFLPTGNGHGDGHANLALQAGHRVRVLAGAYAGQHGFVRSLPAEWTTTPTGYRVLPVEVTLESGPAIRVARCNLEVTGV
ncbi:MAG: hypothetical protein AB1445_02130 [Bacillota bacterium]